MRRYFPENIFTIYFTFIFFYKFLSMCSIVRNLVCSKVILNQGFALLVALKDCSQASELIGIVTTRLFLRK